MDSQTFLFGFCFYYSSPSILALEISIIMGIVSYVRAFFLYSVSFLPLEMTNEDYQPFL